MNRRKRSFPCGIKFPYSSENEDQCQLCIEKCHFRGRLTRAEIEKGAQPCVTCKYATKEKGRVAMYSRVHNEMFICSNKVSPYYNSILNMEFSGNMFYELPTWYGCEFFEPQ